MKMIIDPRDLSIVELQIDDDTSIVVFDSKKDDSEERVESFDFLEIPTPHFAEWVCDRFACEGWCLDLEGKEGLTKYGYTVSRETIIEYLKVFYYAPLSPMEFEVLTDWGKATYVEFLRSASEVFESRPTSGFEQLLINGAKDGATQRLREFLCMYDANISFNSTYQFFKPVERELA